MKFQWLIEDKNIGFVYLQYKKEFIRLLFLVAATNVFRTNILNVA